MKRLGWRYGQKVLPEVFDLPVFWNAELEKLFVTQGTQPTKLLISYWKRSGLLNGIFQKENNRNRYSVSNVLQLMVINELKQMGISNKAIINVIKRFVDYSNGYFVFTPNMREPMFWSEILVAMINLEIGRFSRESLKDGNELYLVVNTDTVVTSHRNIKYILSVLTQDGQHCIVFNMTEMFSRIGRYLSIHRNESQYAAFKDMVK